ncbi:hypothetical protein [Lentibacillus sp. CBA3610]|nr:hypothetical protein [Lentibacillus sp. CBA3610]
MESFLQVRKTTEEQLGRELHENELVFLQWVYKRYTEEEQKGVSAGP